MDKVKYTRHQLSILEAMFQRKAYLDTWEVKKLSDEVGVTTKQIRIWFQNRRAKQRRDERAGLVQEHRLLGASLNSLNSGLCSGSNSPEYVRSAPASPVPYGNLLDVPVASFGQGVQSPRNVSPDHGYFQSTSTSYENVSSPCGYSQSPQGNVSPSYGYPQQAARSYEDASSPIGFTQQGTQAQEVYGWSQQTSRSYETRSSPLGYSQEEPARSPMGYPHQYAPHCSNGSYQQQAVQQSGTVSPHCGYSNQSPVQYYNNESTSWYYQAQNSQTTAQTTLPSAPSQSVAVDAFNLPPGNLLPIPTVVVGQHIDVPVENHATQYYDTNPQREEAHYKNEDYKGTVM